MVKKLKNLYFRVLQSTLEYFRILKMKLKTLPSNYGIGKIRDNFRLMYCVYTVFSNILINRVKGWLERGIKVKVYLIAALLKKDIDYQYYINYSYHNFIPHYKITRRQIHNDHVDCRSICFSKYTTNYYKQWFYKFFRTRYMIHREHCPKKNKFIFNQLCEDLNLKIESYVSKPLKCAGNCGRVIQCGCMCEGVYYRLRHWHHCKKCGTVLCKQCIKCTDHDEYDGITNCAFCLLKKPLRQFKCTTGHFERYREMYSNIDFIDWVFFDDASISDDLFKSTMVKFDHETHDKVVDAMLSFANEREHNLCCQNIYCCTVKNNIFNGNIEFIESFVLKLDYPTRNKVVDVFFEQAYNIMPNACCDSNIPHMVEIFPEKLTEQELEIRKKRGIIYG